MWQGLIHKQNLYFLKIHPWHSIQSAYKQFQLKSLKIHQYKWNNIQAPLKPRTCYETLYYVLCRPINTTIWHAIIASKALTNSQFDGMPLAGQWKRQIKYNHSACTKATMYGSNLVNFCYSLKYSSFKFNTFPQTSIFFMLLILVSGHEAPQDGTLCTYYLAMKPVN